MGAPSSEPMWCSLTSQAVTPIFERQTVYYYSGCLSRDYATEEQSKQQIAVFEKAFAEDKAMIEAQQRVVERTPERRMMDGPVDRWCAQPVPPADGWADRGGADTLSRSAERRFA
jgi:Vanillate O-demethylase oxygenase C-terminal domain